MPATESGPPKGASAGGGLIEQIIRRYIEDDNVVFVFPTEIAAGMWQERALGFHPRAVLPDERFLAWDRFKGIHAAKAERGKREIHERVRELYAESLGKRNADAAARGKPLLRSAIPEQFAASYAAFSPWIARILPHLALFEEKRAQSGDAARPLDGEARDAAFIHGDYKAFLERSGLFEPGWCRRFEGGGKRHIIFFHEAIEGFGAYRQALSPAWFGGTADALPDACGLADFTAVSAPPFAGDKASFALCGDFREEFRRVALKIESLLMRGESSDSIAVSLADAEESESYLSRELETRGIPFRLRFGRALAESGAGRIFPLIQQCSAESFSFSSVKRLLSLKSVAWSKPWAAEGLVRFGIRHRCICSWREGDESVDIWERMFAVAGRGGGSGLAGWYRKLKRNVQALASAKTFADVRARWFAFRDSLLDGKRMGFGEDSGEAGATRESLEIGRCIAELDELVEAEKACPELAPRNPFSFFVARLKKTTYVPQSKSGGVSVFKYKDAAAAPFKFHFVTGATQEDATALHAELRFLRKDRREELGCADEDASLAMFSSYVNGAESGGGVFFSAARHGVGVNAYKTAHSAFAARAGSESEAEEALPDDPLEMEELQRRPSRIYPAQKAGLEAYSALNGDKAARFSFLKEGFEGNADRDALLRIREMLAKKQRDGGRVTRVSPTDLNVFAECPARWFLKRALRLEEAEFSPKLDIADAGEKGNVFHKVAEGLYKFIRETDGAFRSGNAGRYLEEAGKIIRSAMEMELDAAAMEGPLGDLSRPALEARLKEWTEALVAEDSERLDGYVPVMTESEVCLAEGGIEYAGTIDRISRSAGGELTAIVDYKTGWNCPELKDYAVEGGGIRDFQMPFYIFLCENKLKMGVTQAWFFSAMKKAYVRILDTGDSKGNGFKSREELAPAIDAMRAEAEAFADAVGAADFSAKDVYPSDCIGCAFKAVCRHAYAVAGD